MEKKKFASSHLVITLDVIARMKEISGAKTDTDIANDLDVKTNTLNNWKLVGRRISLESVVDFCVKHRASINYVLLGIGPRKMGSCAETNCAQVVNIPPLPH